MYSSLESVDEEVHSYVRRVARLLGQGREVEEAFTRRGEGRSDAKTVELYSPRGSRGERVLSLSDEGIVER